MKKVALIMSGWKRFFTYVYPVGILERIRETNEEINLYIFNSSGDWSLDSDFNIGEYNIFHLPDLREFDGIILDLNNIHYHDVQEYVIRAAKESGRPVVSIANEIEDFYYIGIDNYEAVYGMIRHLHEQHDCKSFWFIMGPKDNYENQVRARALQDYMQEHGLKYSANDFYYNSYEFKCGYNGFLSLVESHPGEIPDAVICANDNIAVGVCEAAAKLGLDVPGDICVTGFDDFDKAGFYSPCITTISHVREAIGYKCIEILLQVWKGIPVAKFNYTKTQAVHTESCGCPPRKNFNRKSYGKEQILYGIETADFEEQVLQLEYELMRCQTIREMSDCIPKCITSMKCDAIYLILDEHMEDFRKEADYFDKHLMEDEEFCIQGYPKEMKVAYVYENGEKRISNRKRISGLFPMFDHEAAGTDFLFMPLHFGKCTVGYFVVRNAVYLMEKQFLFKVLNALTTAMENLHKKEKLEYLNHMLKDLYIKDSMTGMYNRVGYQKLACKEFQEKKKKKENLLIMFYDMDRLKYINDNYGHEYGDFAIQTITKAILKHSSKDAIPVRTGGDEFLVIQDVMPESEMADMIQDIRNEIQEKAIAMEMPVDLTVSIGTVITDMETDRTLDDYVREADEIMYQEKKAKKVERR